MTNLKILQEHENLLLHRKEIVFELHHDKSPTEAEVKQIAVDKFHAKHDSVKVKGIKAAYGSKVFKVEMSVYHSKDKLDNTEIKTKKQREAEKKAAEEAKKAAEQKTEGGEQ